MKRILIVDDDVAVTNYLLVFLVQSGIFEPVVVNDSRQVDERLAGGSFDVVLLDMDMPNVSGIDILRSMRDRGDATPVVVLTGVSDVELAVKAMKFGAFDYLTKPVDEEKLLTVLEAAIEHRELQREIGELPASGLTRQDLTHAAAFAHLPMRDPVMISLFHRAEKLAASDLGIFIWGERGSGKEALARAIHAASPRAEKPFVAVEADALEPAQFPAFFFGQERDWSGTLKESAGVLERADQGTLFLNSIDALTIPVQTRLRRVIQTGEYYRENSTIIRRVGVRMIVASPNDLTQPEYAEMFSQDLLYHLMINSIKIPPLRERPDDIPVLAQHFLAEECAKTGRRIKGFSPEFLDLLMGYSFPHNAQELQSIVALAVTNEETDTITIDSLSSYARGRLAPHAAPSDRGFVPRRLGEVVREHAEGMLDYCEGDRVRAAEELGIEQREFDRILPPPAGGDYW